MKDKIPFDLDAIDALLYGLRDNCGSHRIDYANKELYDFIKTRQRNNADRDESAKLLSDYLTRKMEEERLSSLHIGVEFHLWAFDEKGQVIPATEIQLYPFTK